MQKPSFLKMQTKIVALTLLTTVLMWGVLTAVAAAGMQRIYNQQVDRIIAQTVEQSSRYVSTELRDVVALVHYSLLNGALQAALRGDVKHNTKDYIVAQSVISPILTQLQIQNAYIESTALTVSDTVFQGDVYGADIDSLPLLLEQAAQSNLVYWGTETVLNSATGHMVLPVVLRVPTGDFSVKNEAYILINLDAERLFHHILTLEKELGCTLILHDGQKVIYGDPALFADLAQTRYVQSDTPLEINGWKLACIMDRETLYAPRNAAVREMMVSSLAVLTGCVLLAVLVARTISRPIVRLTGAAQRVASGDYTARVALPGGDEIGTLSRAFDSMTQKIAQNIAELEEKNVQLAQTQSQKRAAEIRTLQAQINPHFLYNTLDSVYWYSMSGRHKEIGLIVEKLSEMLRIGLSKGSEYITLAQEMRHAQDYLQIQQVIFSGKFDFSIRCDAQAQQHRVVKVLLQPLVENSIVHGFSNMEQGGHIDVYAGVEGECLVLRVTDNGCGFAAAQKVPASDYSGFALHNISERLALHYGQDASVSVESVPSERTAVTISIRRERTEEGYV